MVAPSTYPLSILIDDNEVISFTPLESMDFDDNAREVSYFRLTVEDPTTAPARNDTIVISSGGTTIFDGFIVELETKKRDNGITTIYGIEAADKKILLQRSVMDYSELTGSDADILSSLLANAYPDLSADFDFASGVTSFLSDMDLTTNNDSLLDSLNNLSNLAGGADWRMDNAATAQAVITFDSVDEIYTLPVAQVGTETSGGNPDNCLKGTSVTSGNYIAVQIDYDTPQTLTGVDLDYYTSDTGNVRVQIYISIGGGFFTADSEFVAGSINTWETHVFSGVSHTDVEKVQVRFYAQTGTISDMRIDNINIVPNLTGGNVPALQWDSSPDATDFNFDIQSGDEFAFDIDLFEGDIDDFNSITVIGGKEDVTIDWTYESDGDLSRINLETHVKDLVVYKNTGTDGTPIWTLQTDGIWGTDSLTGDGGSKDVLYAVEHHWLWFDTNPSNLSKTIRVTGTVEKPIRVRVEDVTTGDPTYATVIHDDTITSQDEAVALGDSMLQKRNSLRRMTFKTYEPNLKPGQSITIADSARGLNETLTISNIKTKWIGASGHALFTVTCGEDQLPSADIMIAGNDKRSRKTVAGAITTTVTTSFLVDTDGTDLIDTTGDRLYEAV